MKPDMLADIVPYWRRLTSG